MKRLFQIGNTAPDKWETTDIPGSPRDVALALCASLPRGKHAIYIELTPETRYPNGTPQRVGEITVVIA